MALLLPFLLASTLANGQGLVISGQASTLINNMAITRYQYEEEVYRMAVINALDLEFGSSVLSNYERLTITQMEGRSVAGHSDIRNNYLNTYPNGIWVKDNSRECFEHKDDNGYYWMTCKVTGIAKRLETAQVKFIAKSLDGTDPDKDETEIFVNNEQGYLYFRAPESGYIIVFYDDMNRVQRCIPYNNMSESALKIDANREYIFFSEKHASYLDKYDLSVVNEIEYYSDRTLDFNQFYILFSQDPFKGYFLDPSKDLERGYKSFKSMSREGFHEWLQEERIRNKNLQVQRLSIRIEG